jgi:hypothetical protein
MRIPRTALATALLSCWLLAPLAQAASPDEWDPRGLDPPRLELVLRLVVTCSAPERVAPAAASKDGERTEVWPIIGGRFWGKGIRGAVVPGGGDFPVTRPDGVTVVDALYRLRTDDGVTIFIHNRGLEYPAAREEDYRYRLVPEFIAPVGRYDWLNRSTFVATLVWPVPKEMQVARGDNENDRLIEVYRVY